MLISYGVPRDALLRHWRTCKQRTISGSSVPEIQRQKRGRKRISCDACVRSKRKCNRASPCSMCQHFGETCILTQQVNCYVATRPGSITSSTDSPQSSSTSPASTGLATSISAEESGSDGSVSLSPDHNLFMSDEFLSNAITVQPSDYTHFGAWDTTNAINAILGSPISLLPTPPYPVPHMRLNFLSKFTATTGFARSFECGNETERKQIMTALVSTTPRSKIELEIDAFLHVPDEDCLVNVVDDSVNIFESAAPQYLFDNTAKTQTQTQTHYPIIVQDPIYKHPLTLKSREIIGAMYQMITGDSPDTQGGCISNNWSKFEDECRIFFAPEKLERYLVAFWSLWYPNWPAFHKPTFSSTEKPAKLLAAMALIGASLTSDKTEHVQARRWGFAIERWIFSSHELGGDFLGEDSKHQETVCRCKLGGLLDELRACYAMMLFMTWEGTAEQKSRARRLRFSQIIDMSRRLIRLNPNRGSPAAFIKTENLTQGWKEFIFQEELARTLVYVFMIDCAYTLFNNCSPRLGLQELNIPLVCPEICFQAEDANTWNIHLQAWANSRIGKTNPLFSDILRILMKNELPHEQWRLLYEMSSLNFFVIANGTSVQLFRCQL